MQDEKAFLNRAEVEKAEDIVCDACCENVVFYLKDKEGHTFSVGLSTIAECLMFAIEKGDLPKLPVDWVHSLDYVCETKYRFDKNLCEWK